jgi:long-chain acyl-CoA synthetase
MDVDAKVAAVTEPAPSSDDAKPRTIVGWFLRQVGSRGDQPSMHFRSTGRWHTITWGQFGNASRRITSYLISEGVKVGDHVAIWSNNRPEWHIADAAVLCGRMVPVPVYLTFSAEQGAYVLNHSESQVVFVENEALCGRVLSMRSELPKLKRIVVIEGVDKPSQDGFVLPWQEALTRGQAAADKNRKELDTRAAGVELGDIATLIYTSGTTGPPKAVQISHANLEAASESLEEMFEASVDDRMLSYLPLAHVVERLSSEFRSYRYGNQTWFLDGVENLGARLADVRPTIFFGVPRVWEKMQQRIEKAVAEAPFPRGFIARWAMKVARRYDEALDSGEPIPPRLEKLYARADKMVLSKLRQTIGLDQARYMISGAAPIRQDTLHFFRGVGLEILEGYGQSENSAIATMNRPGQQRIGTVGQADPNVEIKIAEDGEILTRSGCNFPGYYKDKDATKEILDDEGWLHTGDIGEIDKDGYLKITDRKKDLIITAGGKNISPSNIEGLLSRHPLIGNAVAIGDQRPFVSALLTLDPEEAPSWAAAHGVSQTGVSELASNKTVLDAIGKHVAEVNSGLSQVEQVKQWSVLPKDFAVGDELTPTLKVKRKVVTEKYASDIDAMYSRKKES